jgi:hypothetical protein
MARRPITPADTANNYPVTVLQWETRRWQNHYTRSWSSDDVDEAPIRGGATLRQEIVAENERRLQHDPARGRITAAVHAQLQPVPSAPRELPVLLMSEEALVARGMTQRGWPVNTTAYRRPVLNVGDDMKNAISSMPR